MEMHEYMSELTGQIRSKKARQEVAREIQNHIEDQAKAYENEGRTRDEALKEAVRQMGNPVEVGIDMDRIHRPRNNWMVLGLAVLLSLAGLLVQYLCIYRLGTGNLYRINGDAFGRQCLYTFLGLGFMAVLYFCDYSMFSRYGKLIGGLFLISTVLVCKLGLVQVINGGHGYMKTVMYLFIPMYGGILYGYRGTGHAGVIRSLLWLLAAAYVSFAVIGGGIGITLDVMSVCFMMLVYVLFRNWYQVKQKSRPLLALGALALAGGYYFYLGMQPYQMARIRAVLSPWSYAREQAFQMVAARDIMKQLKFMGGIAKGGTPEGTPIRLLPGVQYDYVMLQAASTWGLLATGILIGLLVLFLVLLFLTVKKQKNQLGQIIGYGCVMILALETAWNLMLNFGLVFMSTAGLPFFTYGGYHTMAVYGLLGILLSIYRYQDLIWEKNPEKEDYNVLARLGRYRIRTEKMDV